MSPLRRNRQRGVALIIALLVVALAAVLIGGLLDRGELAAARVRNQLREEQAQAYATGLEAYAGRVLLQALADDAPDTASSSWAVPLPPTPVPGGKIVASMRDLNGCFNLNNLLDSNGAVSSDWQLRFKRLLNVLKIDPNLNQSVINWMQAKQASDDQYYLQQAVPYRPAKRGFSHVSELRLVVGVSPQVYASLAPEVCALPRGTKININTASLAVLMSLSDAMTELDARRIWQDGKAYNATLPAWFTKLVPECAVYSLSMPGVPCSLTSTYFLARSDISLDGLTFTYFSLIERSPAHGVRVVERSRGADL